MGGTRVFVGVHRGTVVSCVLVRSEGRSMEDAVGGIGRSHTILFALFFQALEACRLSLYAGSVRALARGAAPTPPCRAEVLYVVRGRC